MKRRRSTATKHEVLIREMVAAKLSKVSMARALGVSIFAVNYSMKTLGLEHGGNQWTTRKFKTHPIVAELREERMNSGLTIERFAQRVGYNKSVISEWERGNRRIHLPGLVAVANALGYEVVLHRIGGA